MSKPIHVFDYKNQQSGIKAPSISALGNYRGWQEIEVTVDSGACDTVMPLSLCSEIGQRESEQQHATGWSTMSPRREHSQRANADASC